MKRIDLTPHKWASYFDNPIISYPINKIDPLFLYSEVIIFSDRLLRDNTYGAFGTYTHVFHRNSYIPYLENKTLKCLSTF